MDMALRINTDYFYRSEAALFNAPTTISGYYQAEVNHDMPELAMREKIM